MELFAYHHHHDKNPWAKAPAWAYELRAQIQHLQEAIMAAIDDLAAAVAAEDTVIDGAVTLLNGIPALIAAAGTDPAALIKLQQDIQAKTVQLSAAIVANTPAPAANSVPSTPQQAQNMAEDAVASNPSSIPQPVPVTDNPNKA